MYSSAVSIATCRRVHFTAGARVPRPGGSRFQEVIALGHEAPKLVAVISYRSPICSSGVDRSCLLFLPLPGLACSPAFSSSA